jgi:phosphate transport system protein
MMAPSSRMHYEEKLRQLNTSVLELGALVENALRAALLALAENNTDLAGEVIAGDATVNSLRTAIEGDCYRLLATEQPVARDMRSIVSALTITTDLERIGDHAKKTALMQLRMVQSPRPIPLSDVQRLGNIAVTMLHSVLEAYTSGDVAVAERVCRTDDEADALYKQIFNVTLSYMLENVQNIGAGTYLLQIAHELERSADRATNIAERVIFTATGELVDLNV